MIMHMVTKKAKKAQKKKKIVAKIEKLLPNYYEVGTKINMQVLQYNQL